MTPSFSRSIPILFALASLAFAQPATSVKWEELTAGESETSRLMVARPDLVHLDRAGTESGRDQNRLDLPAGVYTGIWWYAKFPEHYAGDGTPANRELGEFDMKHWIDGIVATIRAVKSDNNSLKLQQEFFEKSKHPLDTRQ